nr:BlaI/MecI/CopY family transcriptional regulator [uncultured Bacteroides sp.]
MDKLTNQEEEVMIYIWEIGPCYVKDIVTKFPEPYPPYTTIASIVKNLERKEYLSSKRYGNTYEYTPLIKETEYKKTFMSGVVRNYFENSYKEMVSFFAREHKISADELKEIINQIEKGKEEPTKT